MTETNDELREAFMAGFGISGKFWNGKHGAESKNDKAILDIKFRAFMMGLERRRNGDFRKPLIIVPMEANHGAG